jgi:Zn-dependent protease with chaperone function
MSGRMEEPRRRVLDPFLFPSETNARFVLLIAAALLLSFNEGLNLASQYIPFDFQTYPSLDIDLIDPAAVAVGFQEWSFTMAQALRFLAVPFAWTIAVLLLASLIYATHAARLRWRRKLRPMSREQDPQFMDAVADLAARDGISPTPAIEVGENSRSMDGQAFGFAPRYALRLGGRLRLLFRKNPDSFRAIVLHELAHIANGDIARTYFAQAIWYALVLLVVMPALADILFRFTTGLASVAANPSPASLYRLVVLTLPTVFILLLQFSATLALAAAIRASLLRAREIYADLRAARWGAKAALETILLRHDAGGSIFRTGPWRLHPSPAERLAALEDPARLFRLSAELPFFAGALLGLGAAGTAILLTSGGFVLYAGAITGILVLAQVLPDPTLLSGSAATAEIAAPVITGVLVLGLGFLLAYLMSGTLGIEIQRQAAADLANQRRGWRPYLKLWLPASLAAIGFQLGILLTPKSIFANLPDLMNNDPAALAILAALAIVFTFATSILFWVWMVHARFSSLRFFRSAASNASLQRRRRLLTLFSAGLLFILIIPPMLGPVVMEQVMFAMDEFTLQLILLAIGAFAAGLGLFLAALGSTGLVLFIYPRIRSARCPACSSALPGYILGQICTRCGQDLAGEMFTALQPLGPDSALHRA